MDQPAQAATRRLRFPWLQTLLALFAFGIAGYALASYAGPQATNAGFVQGKNYYDAFSPHPLWTLALVVHAVCGSVALITGGLQWVITRSKLRVSKPSVFRRSHLIIGPLYVAAIILGCISGGYLAAYAMGGIVSSIGFALLDLVWIGSTIAALVFSLRLRKATAGPSSDDQRDTISTTVIAKLRKQHHRWMVVSFACTAAAITLRIWLPLSMLAGLDFITAYRIIAWLCWVPNLVVAALILKHKQNAPT